MGVSLNNLDDFKKTQIELLTQAQNGWKVWVNIFSKRQKDVKELSDADVNQFDLLNLYTVYGICLNKSKTAIEIYDRLIEAIKNDNCDQGEYNRGKTQVEIIANTIKNKLLEIKPLADFYFPKIDDVQSKD